MNFKNLVVDEKLTLDELQEELKHERVMRYAAEGSLRRAIEEVKSLTEERDTLKSILEGNGIFQISEPKFKKITLNGRDYLQVI